MNFGKKRIYVGAAVLAAVIAGGWWLHSAYQTPILMYHHIDHRSSEWKLSVSPESFARQMEFLRAHQYQVLALSDYVQRLKNKEKIPRKSVVITFDDGYDNNFINAFPVLQILRMPATIFLQEDGIDREGYMTEEDIRILLDHGIEIGSHTIHHGFLPHLSDEEQQAEIFDSKKLLEDRLGIPIRTFSYPGGGFDARARQRAIDAGYDGAVATHPGLDYPDLDPYALKRIRVSRTADNLFIFWFKISGYYTYLEELRG